MASPEPHWLQLCRWPLGREGLERAHSRDVSGWVCPLRLQEEPSTCPRNAVGIHACRLHPLVLSALDRLRGGRGYLLGEKEFCSEGGAQQEA